jgi:undecaprenyl-diphosphatase
MLVGVEVPWSDRKPPSIALLYASIGFAVATVLAIFVETPLPEALAPYQPWALWDTGIDLLEWVILLPADPHALPVLLVLAVLATTLVKRWRGALPPLATIAFVHLFTRYTTNLLKDGTGRYRPSEWLKKGVEGSFGYDKGVSFPSGHVVLFASIVIPMLYVYPKTRVAALPLAAVVLFVAMARIAVNAHWISDTLASVSLVLLVTWAVSFATRPLRA